MDKTQLLGEMERLLEAGDMQGLEKFVIEHFKEFPEDAQGKILMQFFREALQNEEGKAQIAELQKEGIDAMEKIAAAKADIEAAQQESTQS